MKMMRPIDEKVYDETKLLRKPLTSSGDPSKKNKMCCCRPENLHDESEKF